MMQVVLVHHPIGMSLGIVDEIPMRRERVQAPRASFHVELGQQRVLGCGERARSEAHDECYGAQGSAKRPSSDAHASYPHGMSLLRVLTVNTLSIGHEPSAFSARRFRD